MSISWGGYNNHLRVGIDYSISPSSPGSSDTSVVVTWKYYVGTDGWDWSDTQTLHESADGWGGTSNSYSNNLSSGSKLIDTQKITYSISSSSGTKSASANVTGAYNGATPSHSVTITLPNQPSSAPSAGENPTIGTITSSGFVVNWSYPSDDGGVSVDVYELQIADSPGFTSPIFDSASLASRLHTQTGLASNTTYWARVRAHNANGWGPWTNGAASATTLSSAPDTPSSLGVIGRGQTTLNIGWAAPNPNGGGAITYECVCASDSGFTHTVASYSGASTSNKFTGLSNGTTYYFRVNATNSGGTSSWSTTISPETLESTTYTDAGDYVTLVNNLASAVADKFVHLGAGLHLVSTSAATLATSTVVDLDLSTVLDTMGPDNPTHHTTSSYDNVTINYPGVYLIEFSFLYKESVAGGAGTAFYQTIYVNGVATPTTSVPNGGATVIHTPSDHATSSGYRKMVHTARLAVGDTVGWAVQQTSGSSMTQPTPTSGLYAIGKVTLIGF